MSGIRCCAPWAATPFPFSLVAYTGLPFGTDALIQVEDFDHGGEGIAYHDLDAANNGLTKYRGNSGVDIQPTTDIGGGFNTGYVKAGEWLQYQLNVAQAGTYNLDVRVASAAAGGAFHFELDGVNISGSGVHTIALGDHGAFRGVSGQRGEEPSPPWSDLGSVRYAQRVAKLVGGQQPSNAAFVLRCLNSFWRCRNRWRVRSGKWPVQR